MEKKDTAPSAAGKAREENAAIAYREKKSHVAGTVLNNNQGWSFTVALVNKLTLQPRLKL